MPENIKKRLVFSCSTLAGAGKIVDGIRRTSRELAKFALRQRDDTIFVLDAGQDRPLTIKSEWLLPIIENSAVVDLSHFPDRWTTRPRWRHRLPYRLQQAVRWFQRPRLMAFSFLERLRLRGIATALAGTLQDRIVSPKLRAELYAGSDRSKAFLPFDMAIGTPFEYQQRDILIMTGADWPDMVDRLNHADPQSAPAFVLLCYDIIPLLFPHFFPEKVSVMFRECFHVLLARVDLVIVTANRIAGDIRTYCEANRIRPPRTAVVTLGAASYAQSVQRADLPPQLKPNKFILFVSTIEPRKGHRTLLSVWRQLSAQGIPEANDFKMVFVGRKGWLVDELVAEIESDPTFGNSLLWLSGVGDDLLETLYAECAFCVYPSVYEGFGLPLIEAFRHGKAVISSNGGALAETAGEFAPAIDPLDERAWFDKLKLWIEDPAERLRFETKIRREFQPRSWDQVGNEFFSAVDREIEFPIKRQTVS